MAVAFVINQAVPVQSMQYRYNTADVSDTYIHRTVDAMMKGRAMIIMAHLACLLRS
jgi:S-adenosylmethionine synthetase